MKKMSLTGNLDPHTSIGIPNTMTPKVLHHLVHNGILTRANGLFEHQKSQMRLYIHAVPAWENESPPGLCYILICARSTNMT